jgi:hypothetical protein
MALLTVTTVPAAGAVTALAAVASSDTISASDIGARGVVLDVNNGSGSSVTVTISDPGTTPAGNAGTARTVAVAAGARKRIFVGPGNVDPSTGVATVSYSATTSVTAEAIRY